MRGDAPTRDMRIGPPESGAVAAPPKFNAKALFDEKAMGEGNPYLVVVNSGLEQLAYLESAVSGMDTLKTAARLNRQAAIALQAVFEGATRNAGFTDIVRRIAEVGLGYTKQALRNEVA